MRISKSQIDTFLTCAYKWHIQYVQGLRSRSYELGPAALGDVVHTGLAAALNTFALDYQQGVTSEYYLLDRSIKAAIEHWDSENRPQDKEVLAYNSEGEVVFVDDIEFYTEWDEMLSDAFQIARRTIRNLRLIDNYVPVFIDDEPIIEYRIELKIPETKFEFVGVIDAVLHNLTTGLFEVIDWKVRRSFTDTDAEELNSQIGIYQYALRQLGIDAPMGVVYQIKNKPPRYPSLNKNETMSRQKIITDWDTYKEALLVNGLDPSDYLDMKDKLAEVEFYRPLLVVRSHEVTDLLWLNMIAHAERIDNETIFPRAYGYPCRNCPFNALCQAELYGYDLETVIEDRYEYAQWVDTEDDE